MSAGWPLRTMAMRYMRDSFSGGFRGGQRVDGLGDADLRHLLVGGEVDAAALVALEVQDAFDASDREYFQDGAGHDADAGVVAGGAAHDDAVTCGERVGHGGAPWVRAGQLVRCAGKACAHSSPVAGRTICVTPWWRRMDCGQATALRISGRAGMSTRVNAQPPIQTP